MAEELAGGAEGGLEDPDEREDGERERGPMDEPGMMHVVSERCAGENRDDTYADERWCEKMEKRDQEMAIDAGRSPSGLENA